MDKILIYCLVGLGVGALSGALGIGGGVLILPILMWLGFEQRKATGTTLGVMVPPIGLLAAWKYWSDGELDVTAAICIAIAFFIGGYLGAFIKDYVPKEALRVGLGFLLLYVGIYYIFTTGRDFASFVKALIIFIPSFLIYQLLRLLGRQYRMKKLAEEFAKQYEKPKQEPDYYI